MVHRWTAKPLEQAPPGTRPSKGIQECMLMKLVSTGIAPEAWLCATDQLLSAAKHTNEPCRTSHCLSRPSDTAGLSKSFVWEAGQSFRAGGVLGGPGRQVYTLPKTGKHRAPAP
eukprot:scaffold299559_cov22-Tisochrysis_lutea.AAC.1